MSPTKGRPYLLKSSARAIGQPPLKTGTLIPETGIYKVIHGEHRLPHEVILFQGEKFPRCAKCRDKVCFELVYPAEEIHTVQVLCTLLEGKPVFQRDQDGPCYH